MHLFKWKFNFRNLFFPPRQKFTFWIIKIMRLRILEMLRKVRETDWRYSKLLSEVHQKFLNIFDNFWLVDLKHALMHFQRFPNLSRGVCISRRKNFQIDDLFSSLGAIDCCTKLWLIFLTSCTDIVNISRFSTLSYVKNGQYILSTLIVLLAIMLRTLKYWQRIVPRSFESPLPWFEA